MWPGVRASRALLALSLLASACGDDAPTGSSVGGAGGSGLGGGGAMNAAAKAGAASGGMGGGASANLGGSSGAGNAGGGNGGTESKSMLSLKQPIERGDKLVLEFGQTYFEVTPSHGARITSLRHAGQELLMLTGASNYDV
jgi:hypothetical protein